MMTSPEDKVQALMMKFLQRRRNIQPNKADGFLTTNTLADSESSGDGSNSGATSASSGQN